MRRYVRVVLVAFLLSLTLQATGFAANANPRSVPTNYGLELDGVFAGWLYSAEGGGATSDVVVDKLGPDHIARKHIAGVKYEDITVAVGPGMSTAFYQWIKDSFDHKATRKNGAIITAEHNGNVLSRTAFTNALITEVGFPALDAASKDAAKMTIKFAPEYTRRVSATGKVAGISAKGDQKKWLPANFRLRIDGLDDATSRVNSIEAIVVKQKVAENPVGEVRDFEVEPTKLEIPNLAFTVAESSADPLYAWLDDFVIQGNNGQDQEKTGSLEFLGPDLKEVLFRLDFQGLGIFKLTPDKLEAGAESIRRVRAELYVEEMAFSR
ncbi:MAG TPA: phage tail protein [Symbiobacteriaceae bacterium]|jgi:phage tail-like protein